MSTSVTSVRILGGTSNVSSNTVAATSTIQDLVACVPSFIRVPFAPILYATLNTWMKINSVRAHIARLTSQKANGDYPPEIKGSVKVPTVQMSKDAREATNLAVTLESKYNQACETARREMLDALISAKQDELAHLQTLIEPSVLQLEVENRTKPTIEDLQKDLNITITKDVATDVVSVTGGPAPLPQEMAFFLNNALPMLRRCAVLAHTAHDREAARKFKAVRVVEKKVGDVVMADAEASNKPTQALIDDALKAFAAKFKMVRTDKKKPGPSKKPKPEASSSSDKTEKKKKKKKDKGKDADGEGKGKGKGKKKKGKSSGKKAN